MTAVWTPPGRQYFRDFGGSPLSLGTIELYIPNTFTPKLSWADEAQTTSNTNPVALDVAGSCTIWGTGLYRMIAKDQDGVQVFDVVTGFIGGGAGGGDVFGPGASVSGNFAVWASTDGTQIADGGVVGTLAHLSSVNDGNWVGTPLSVPHGGTGVTDVAGIKTLLGLGALAFLNTITASLVSDFATAQEANLATMLVQGTNVTIVHDAGLHTFTFSASGGSGGGDVTGPGSSVNGGLVQFNGTTGALIKDSAVVPSANGFSLISAANYAAMRTLLGLTAAATTAIGTSGATIPLLSTANTWTLAQTFTLAPVFSDASGTRTALGLGTAALSATTDFEPAGAYSGINPQVASYTLVAGDQGKLVTMTVAGANNLTVPKQATVAWPARARVDVASLGAGQTTIVADTGVTISATPGLKLRTQNSGASLVRLAADSWLLTGDLAA